MGNGNQLAVLDDFDAAVLAIKDEPSVRDFILQMEALELLLKSAYMFNAQARKFARLEAMAFVRIAELGLAKSIGDGDKKRTAEWLAGMKPKDRERVIAVCGEQGVTVHYYWRNVVREGELNRDAMDAMKRQGRLAINAFQENGMVELNDYIKASGRVPYDIAKGFKDVIRDRIRSQGGHGLGDARGTYVTVRKADELFSEIIENKVKSIRRDVNRLRSILGEAGRDGESVETAVIERYSNFSDEITEESAIGMMLCLLGIARPCWRTGSDRGKYAMVSNVLGKLGIDKEWLAAMIVANRTEAA